MHRAVTDEANRTVTARSTCIRAGERLFAMRQILTPAVRGELMIDKLSLALL
jgi:hypothetical protein